MRRSTPALLMLPLVAACASTFDTSRPPSVTADASYATAYWFRGTPINTKGVVQGSVAASLPTTDGGAIGAATWVNLDAAADTGDGISPDGNAREVTEADLTLDYSRSFGAFDATAGVISYNFPNLVGNSTFEVFVAVSTVFVGLTHGLTLYYDVDELDDLYLTYDLSHDVALAEDWTLTLAAQVGYMGKGQSEFYFGVDESGLSNLEGAATLQYALDGATSAFLSVHGVTPVASALKDALDDAGYDDSGLWGALGLSWSL